MCGLLTVLLLASLGNAMPFSESLAPPDELMALFHDVWHWKTHQSPQFATKEKCVSFLSRAESMKTLNVSWIDNFNLQTLIEDLKTFKENFKFLKYFFPVSVLEGPQLNFRQMVEKQMVLRSYNDYQKLLSRYGEFPRQAQEVLKLMKDGIEAGITPSRHAMEGVVEQFEGLLKVDIEDSVFFQPFLYLPNIISDEQRKTLKQQAHERIVQDLLPAFRTIKEFIQTDYLPATRDSISCSSLPGGEEYYMACLKFHTSTYLTPEKIHSFGLSEINRITAKIQNLSEDAGFAANISLRNLSQAFENPNGLYESFLHTTYDILYPAVANFIRDFIPDNLSIVISPGSETALPLSYLIPSLDKTRLGTLYMDVSKDKLLSPIEMPAKAAHLTFPGYHFHSSFLQNDMSVPNFRKAVDDVRISDAPAKLPLHTAFFEGWAVYSEAVADELGLYTETYQRLGHYFLELARSSMLVVDTGIHLYGWSLRESLEYLKNTTALSDEAAKLEVLKTIIWPGRSCAHKIGEIKIKELWQRSRSVLGQAFRPQDFHKIVLQCTGHLSLLQECISHYIEENSEPTGEASEEVATDVTEESENGADLAPKSSSSVPLCESLVYAIIFYSTFSQL